MLYYIGYKYGNLMKEKRKNVENPTHFEGGNGICLAKNARKIKENVRKNVDIFFG